MFVESISGSYSGVMGLPLFETAALPAEFGVPLRLSPPPSSEMMRSHERRDPH